MTEFQDLAKKGGWEAEGWPNCAYTVSKVGVNVYTRWVIWLSLCIFLKVSFPQDFTRSVWRRRQWCSCKQHPPWDQAQQDPAAERDPPGGRSLRHRQLRLCPRQGAQGGDFVAQFDSNQVGRSRQQAQSPQQRCLQSELSGQYILRYIQSITINFIVHQAIYLIKNILNAMICDKVTYIRNEM